jgi:hypothetical protein
MTGVDGLGPSRWSIDVGDTVADIAWSPTDGRIGIGCSGGEVVVVNETGDTVDRRLPHRSGTSCVTWFDGEVASGGVDGWVDIGGQRERVGGWVSALTVGAAGIGVAHGRHVSILGGATSDPLAASVAQVRWASGSNVRDGSLVACGHGYVTEFHADLSTRDDANLVWGGSVAHFDWSPNRRWAAASTRGTTNYLWPRPTDGHRSGRVVDPEIHIHVLPGPTSDGRLVRFDPTGRYLGIATSGGLAVFDLDEVHPVAGPPGRLMPLFCTVQAFCWWPDAPVAVLGVTTDAGGGGLLLVRCDEQAAPIGVVDLSTPVTHLSWSPGLDTLAVACGDGTVTALPRHVDWDWRSSTDQWDITDQL